MSSNLTEVQKKNAVLLYSIKNNIRRGIGGFFGHQRDCRPRRCPYPLLLYTGILKIILKINSQILL